MCLWPSLLFYCTTEHSLTKATDLAVKKVPVLAVQQKNVTPKPRWWLVGVSTPLGSSLGFGYIFAPHSFPPSFCLHHIHRPVTAAHEIAAQTPIGTWFFAAQFLTTITRKSGSQQESYAAGAAKNSIW